MEFIEIFILFLIGIAAIMYVKKLYTEVEYKKTSDGKNTYLVRRVGDSQAAADYLEDIADRLEKLVKYLTLKYSDRDEVKRLFSNFNKKNISEGSPESNYTSYSVNKGERIVLCIRQKNDNSFVDKNLIMYVAIHELAHLACDDVGHTAKFWDTFKFLLTEAVEAGLYVKEDYSKSPQPYCGITVTHSII
jgi:predicted metal-dependent hydrolase